MSFQYVNKQYLHILLPTLLGMLSNSLYCLVDVYFISAGAGSMGLAALNIAMPIYTIYSAIGLLLGAGGATLMSIAHGSNDKELGNKTFTLSMVLMSLAGILISIIGTIFVRDFAYLLGSSEELIEPVVLYMRPIIITAAPFIIMYAASLLLRSDHNPKLAMIAMVIGNISNIILDYVFVILLDMGIEGASIATAISPIITILVAALHFLKHQNSVRFVKDFYDRSIFQRMISAGLGSGVMEISAGAVILIFNAVILAVGDAQALAAYAIITNIAYVMKGLLAGFAQAAQPLIASSYGAHNQTMIKSVLHISLWYAGIFSIVVYGLFFMVPQQIAGIFASHDQQLISLAARGIRIYFLSLGCMAVNTILMYYFQSLEAGRFSTMIALAKGFIFVLAGIVLFVPFLKLDGIWLVVPAAEGMSVLLGYWLYKKKNYLVF